jgi:hypothetical protein
MKKVGWISVNIDFECWGFGIVVLKNSESDEYLFSIDIQILFADILIKLKKQS